jgi:hypothetical protein
MRKIVLALAATSLTVPALPASTAFAHDSGRYHSHSQTWRGADGRTYCRKPNGTTGLVIGGAAGALAGREIDKRGSRATGTILGAAVGALLGRHVQRNVISRCR